MQATLPARLYGCPAAWARERAAVFDRAWLCIGHQAVQANLSGSAYDTGVLSVRHEAAVGWFQSRLAEVHA